MTLSATTKILTKRYVDSGRTVSEMAPLFGVTPTVMRARLRMWGLKAQPSQRGLENKRRVLTLCNEGKTANEISQITGHVYNILRSNNIKSQRPKSRVRSERNSAMCAMYLKGHTLEEVGASFGVSRERIRQILVVNKITERRTAQREIRQHRKTLERQIMTLYLEGMTRREAAKSLGIKQSELTHFRSPTATQHKVHRVARFWRGVKKSTEPHPELGTPCWIWQQSRNPITGYGSYGVGRRNASAHRYAYTIVKGKPQNWVLHRCDERLCVNPDHLYDGTGVDNARDRDKNGFRGRWATGLNFAKAEDIRAELANGGDLGQIAEREGVCTTTIYNIQRNKIWTREHHSRFTDEQIWAVWKLRGQKSVPEVQKETGVGNNSVYAIWNGSKGNHVTGLPKYIPGGRKPPHLITFNEETLTLSAWAKRLGYVPNSLRYRLKHMPIHKALTPKKN